MLNDEGRAQEGETVPSAEGEGGSTTTTGTTTSTNTTSGNTTSGAVTTIVNVAKNIFGKAADAGALILVVDPNNPATPNTRYNEANNTIEVYSPTLGKWIAVTVQLKNSNIDLSDFSLKEIQSYLSSGTPFPKFPLLKDVVKSAAKVETKSPTPKWVWWGIGGVAVLGGLGVVYWLSVRNKRKIKNEPKY